MQNEVLEGKSYYFDEFGNKYLEVEYKKGDVVEAFSFVTVRGKVLKFECEVEFF